MTGVQTCALPILTAWFPRGGDGKATTAVAGETTINAGDATPNSDRTDSGERGRNSCWKIVIVMVTE